MWVFIKRKTTIAGTVKVDVEKFGFKYRNEAISYLRDMGYSHEGEDWYFNKKERTMCLIQEIKVF